MLVIIQSTEHVSMQGILGDGKWVSSHILGETFITQEKLHDLSPKSAHEMFSPNFRVGWGLDPRLPVLVCIRHMVSGGCPSNVLAKVTLIKKKNIYYWLNCWNMYFVLMLMKRKDLHTETPAATLRVLTLVTLHSYLGYFPS